MKPELWEQWKKQTWKGNFLKIAQARDGSAVMMSPDARSRHLYVTGSTGSGKSKLLEYMIRQDIMSWDDTKCGMLVLDPHGSIYDDVLHWVGDNSFQIGRAHV